MEAELVLVAKPTCLSMVNIHTSSTYTKFNISVHYFKLVPVTIMSINHLCLLIGAVPQIEIEMVDCDLELPFMCVSNGFKTTPKPGKYRHFTGKNHVHFHETSEINSYVL